MANINIEMLKNKLYPVAKALFMIGETLVDESKQHISEQEALGKIRSYLREADVICSRYGVDRLIEDCTYTKPVSNTLEHVAYRNILDLICNIPEEEIVDIEKLVAKTVKYEGNDESDFVYCPTCNEILGINESVFWAFEESDGYIYCPKCGQKLKQE